MKKQQRDRSLVLMLRAALAAGSAAFAVTAAAAPECYQWSRFSKERFVLDIEGHSDLSQNQRAFSVHGKHVGVCGDKTIATVTGTIVRATSPLPVTGTHMGLRTHSFRATTDELDAHVIFCKEVTLDCTLEQSQTPKTWTCFGRNEWDAVLARGRGLQTTLTKLSPQDGSCKIFQDSGGFSPEQVPRGDEFSGVLGRRR